MDLSRNKIKMICQIEILEFHFFYIKSDNNLLASKTFIGKVFI